MKEGENLMDVNYCEVCEHCSEKDGIMTCTAEKKHQAINLRYREWILPEWCPALPENASTRSQ